MAAARPLSPDAWSLEENFRRGMALLQAGRTREAVGYLEAILAACDAGQACAGEDRVCFALGNLYAQAVQTRPQAIRTYRRGLALNPLSAPGHDGLGLVLLESGQVLGALGEFKVALQLDPGLASAYVHLARLFFHHVESAELAQEYAHIAEEFGPRSSAVLARLSLELMELSREQTYQGLYSKGHQLKNLMGLMGSRLRGLVRQARGTETWEAELGELAAEQERLYAEWVKYLGAMKPEAVRLVPLDPAQVAQRVFAALRIQAGDAVLRLRVQEGVPPVEADERLLREALLNLCLNGLEALGGRPGHLVLGLGCDLDQGLVFFEVEDDGPGIAPEHLGRVFEPGFSTKEKGNGYGLSIARRIAHAHHGELRVKSRLGHGTVFRLDLPINFEVAQGAAPAEAMG
jgi:signal transduction histidine kinase